MARFFREDFNRERDFIVRLPLVANGKNLTPGSPLDKSIFTVRRLRQLYDSRRIEYAPADAPTVVEQTPPAVEAALASVSPEKTKRRRPGGSIQRRRPREAA